MSGNGSTIVDGVTGVVVELEEVEVPQSLLQRIPVGVRKAMYVAGVILGVVGTIAPAVAAMLTGETASLVVSLGALALAINSLMARANVSTV